MKPTHRPQRKKVAKRRVDHGGSRSGRLPVVSVVRRGGGPPGRPPRGAAAAWRETAVIRLHRHRPLFGFVLLVLMTMLAGLPLRAGEPGVRASEGGGLPDRIPCVPSSRILIHYTWSPESPAPSRVELWYTQDEGRTWQKASLTEAAPSPVVFDAPGDGLYGFFLVLHGPHGSMPAPSSGTAAQRWVRIDRTAPVVQVLALAPDTRFELNHEIHIRWSAQDENLGDRPVALHYRTEGMRTFKPIAEALAATSSYRWTVPGDVNGRVEIKVSVTDRAGNRGRYVADWLEIAGETAVRGGAAAGAATGAPGPVPGPEVARSSAGVSGIHGEPDAGAHFLDEGRVIQAKKRYDLGTWHRLRGEYGVALARYRDALREDPGFLAARNDLAGILTLQGKLKQAEQEYRRILVRDTTHRPALKGLALVQAKRRHYRSAHETLQKLLLQDPKDAEIWLHFGDVCMFMGDRPAAREAWTKAASLSGASDEIRRRARKRLDIYGSHGAALALDGAAPG